MKALVLAGGSGTRL
ncbi:hypothetical protein, partial [Frankia sp. AvcI1]